MWSNPQFPTNLVTFTEEFLTGKLHFLCSVNTNCAPLKNIEVFHLFRRFKEVNGKFKNYEGESKSFKDVQESKRIKEFEGGVGAL